jgi:hypothetical protein
MSPDPPQLLAALNHVLRRRILRTFDSHEQLIGSPQLVQALNCPLSEVTYHAAILVKSGALEVTETRNVHGVRERSYRLTVAGQAEWVQAVLEASQESDDDGREIAN